MFLEYSLCRFPAEVGLCTFNTKDVNDQMEEFNFQVKGES